MNNRDDENEYILQNKKYLDYIPRVAFFFLLLIFFKNEVYIWKGHIMYMTPDLKRARGGVAAFYSSLYHFIEMQGFSPFFLRR